MLYIVCGKKESLNRAGGLLWIDLLGAGDAVLAVVAPFAKAGWSIRDLVHLGNIAGAIKVQILGHQTHITKALLEEHL